MIISLDYNSSVPIYLQLRNQIVIGIGKDHIKLGEKLPTVRQMAEDLGVNVMTVNKAYALLKSEGFITIDRRHGAKINTIFDGKWEFKEYLEDNLSLFIAEASLKGFSKDEFYTICDRIFNNMRSNTIITEG